MYRLEIWPETAGRLAARAILAGVAADETQPFEVRVAALDAVGALQDHLPVGQVLAPVEVADGTVQDARRLLLDDASLQSTARERLATSRAAARLAGL